MPEAVSVAVVLSIHDDPFHTASQTSASFVSTPSAMRSNAAQPAR